MRMIQAKFPRVAYDKIPYEENGERKMVLQLMVLLCNFTTHKMGMNTILNSYLPAHSKDKNFGLQENNIDETADNIFDDNFVY